MQFCEIWPGMDLGLILTDFPNEHRKCKLLGGLGACPNGNFFSILTSQSPLSRVSESFRQDNLASSFSSDEALQLNTSIMKNLTDFGKTMETGVDPRLLAFHFLRLQ